MQVLSDTSILPKLDSLCIGYKRSTTSPAQEAAEEQFELALLELSQVRKIKALSVPVLSPSTRKTLTDTVDGLTEVSTSDFHSDYRPVG